MPTEKEVIDRLTDSSKYTGAHKNRFDDSGKGKGLVGRENVVKCDGSTESASRKHAVHSMEKAEPKKPVVSGTIGKQKFGMQADTPISVMLYKNGDKHHTGTKIIVKKTFRTMEQFTEHVQKQGITPKSGMVKKFYKADLKTLVKEVADFEDGSHYLVSGPEKPADDKDHIPSSFLSLG